MKPTKKMGLAFCMFVAAALVLAFSSVCRAADVVQFNKPPLAIQQEMQLQKKPPAARFMCFPPLVLNAAKTVCVCPSYMVASGASCACPANSVLNAAKTACDCISGYYKKSGASTCSVQLLPGAQCYGDPNECKNPGACVDPKYLNKRICESRTSCPCTLPYEFCSGGQCLAKHDDNKWCGQESECKSEACIKNVCSQPPTCNGPHQLLRADKTGCACMQGYNWDGNKCVCPAGQGFNADGNCEDTEKMKRDDCIEDAGAALYITKNCTDPQVVDKFCRVAAGQDDYVGGPWRDRICKYVDPLPPESLCSDKGLYCRLATSNYMALRCQGAGDESNVDSQWKWNAFYQPSGEEEKTLFGRPESAMKTCDQIKADINQGKLKECNWQ